jgi:imidazolonepropionase-like amidohydrolase
LEIVAGKFFAVFLLAWPIAYWDIASWAQRWTYVAGVVVWLVYNGLLFALFQKAAAHCHAGEGVKEAVRAGVRSIEHGTYLDDEVCDAMRERGVLLVTTRMIVTELLEFGMEHGMPEVSFRKLEYAAATHEEAIAKAHAAGVRIAMGTDAAMTGRLLPAAWGNQTRELPLLAAAGMDPLQVIEATTANGPDTLGLQAPRSGQLLAGYDADVIAVDGDPTQDVSILAEPDNITHVVARGQLVKAPVAA